MAIALVGSSVDDNLSGAAATTFVATLPGGTAAGDVVLLDLLVTGNLAAAPTGVPSGAVNLLAWGSPGGGESITSGLWYYLVPSTPPSTLTFTFAAAREGSLLWSSWSGVSNTTPLDAAIGVTAGTNGWAAANANPTVVPAVTSVTAGARLIAGIHLGSGPSEVITPPSGSTTLANGGRRQGFMVDRGVLTSPGASTTATYTYTNGYRTRGWQVALRPDASGPPSGAISGVSTATLTDPVARWTKGTTRVSWYDGTNWGAVLPTSTGHRLFTNLASPSAGTVVDSRTGSRPAVVRDGTWLGILRGEPTQSRFSSYNIASSYAALVTDTVVPLTPANTDQSPIALCRSANGYLWAAMVAANKVTVTRSTDNGATWGTAQDVVTGWTLFPTGVVSLLATGTSVVLLASGNDGSGRAALSIPQASAAYTAGSWTTETLPALASGAESDDHLAATVAPDGRVFAVAKTTNAGANVQLVYVLVRTTSGTWTSYNVEVGPDDDGDGSTAPGYTRPNIALTGSNVLVTFGSIYSPQSLSYRTAAMSNLSTWSARSTLLTGPNYWDGSQLPDSANIYAAAGDFPILAHEVDSDSIILSWRASGVVVPTFTHTVTGFSTDTSIRAKVKVGSATSVRLKVATNSGLTTGVVYGSASTPDSDGYAEVVCTGLSAWTQYYYGLEITGDGVVTTAQVGKAKTLPVAGTPTNFTIAFGSCNDYIAPPPTSITAFTNIAARNPDFFVHLGDFAYSDNSSTSQASHRADLETTINYNASMRTVLAGSNGLYMKSDHDAGPNNSFPGTQTPANRAAMLQVIPDLDCPDPNGLYGSRVVGRVKLIALDTRYFAVQGGTTRIGATQKAWLFAELSTSEPFKIIFTDSTWIDNTTPETNGDKWGNFIAERNEIGDFIENDAVGKVVLAHGDTHMVGADNGSHNSWGGFPTYCGGPFFNYSSIKTANGSADWSQSTYPTSDDVAVSQYAWFSIADAGSNITLSFTGYDSSNTSRVTHTYVVTPTEEHSGSISLSGSGTLAVAGGKNITSSQSLSGSGTLAVSGSKNVSGSLSLSGSGTLGLAGGKNATGSLGLSGAGTLAVAGSGMTAAGSRALSGSGTLGLVGGKNVSGTLGLSGSGTLAAAGTAMTVVGSRGLSGSGTLGLSGSGAQDSEGSIALSGSGTLGLVGSKSVTGSIALSGSGSLTTSGLPGWTTSLALSGSGSLGLASSSMTISASIGLSGSGTLGLVGGKNVSGTLGLSGSGTLGRSGAFDIKQTQALSGSGTLGLAATSQTHSGSLALNGSGLFQPSGEGEQVGSGTFTGTGSGSLTLSGSVITTSGSVALSGAGILSLEGSKSVSGSAGLSGSGTLALVTVTITTAGSRAFSGSGSLGLSGAGAAEGEGSLGLTGLGALGFTGVPATTGTRSLSGAGTLGLSGSGSTEGEGSISLTGSGSLSIEGHAFFESILALGGGGSLALSGTGSGEAEGSVTLSGVGNLTLTAGAVTVSGSSSLAGAGTLTLVGGVSSGGGTLTLSGAGTLVVAGVDDGFEWPATVTLTGVRYSVTLTPVPQSSGTLTPVYDGINLNVLEP